MASEWSTGRLGDCVLLQSGGTPSKSQPDFWDGDIAWVSAKDMKSYWIEDTEDHLSEKGAKEATRIVEKGTTLLLVRGMTLHNDIPICRTRRSAAFNQDVKAVLARDRTQPDFVPYLLLGNKEKLLSIVDSAGHGTGRLNSDTLLNLPVCIPPVGEQRAIAHILGTLDDKIELNRRMNETLEAIARALFKSWFVDFDPVRAKAEGRDPSLPKPLIDLFPARLVDSELGEIPEGWRVAPLSECVDVVRGLSYKGSGLSKDGVPMHNLNSIYEGGGYKHDGLKHYEGEYKPQHVARAGDLIVANTEQGHHRLLIGYAAIVPTCFKGQSLFSHHIYRVRTKSRSGLTPDLLCHLLNTSVMHDTVSGYANGTTVNMLPMDGLQTPQVLVPPARVVTAFNDIAETARKRHEEMVGEARTLAALRDTLLPDLISGGVRVKDTERLVGREPTTLSEVPA